MAVNRFIVKFTTLVEGSSKEGDDLKENMKNIFNGEKRVVRESIVLDDVRNFRKEGDKIVFFMRYGAPDIEWVFADKEECRRVDDKLFKEFLSNSDISEKDIFDAAKRQDWRKQND